jgi:hypothetical protein
VLCDGERIRWPKRVTLPDVPSRFLLLVGLAPGARYDVQLTSGFAPGSPVWRLQVEANDAGVHPVALGRQGRTASGCAGWTRRKGARDDCGRRRSGSRSSLGSRRGRASRARTRPSPDAEDHAPVLFDTPRRTRSSSAPAGLPARQPLEPGHLERCRCTRTRRA